MMKRLFIPMLASGLLLVTGAAHSEPDTFQIRSWAAACANCHGTGGHAEKGNETLAGANPEKMLQKLMDFKSGVKPGTIMNQLAKGYTDEQLAAITQWFAKQKK